MTVCVLEGLDMSLCNGKGRVQSPLDWMHWLPDELNERLHVCLRGFKMSLCNGMGKLQSPLN